MEWSGLTATSDGPLSLQNHGRTGLRIGEVCKVDTDRVPASVTSGMQIVTGSAGKLRAAVFLAIEFTALDGPSAPVPILLSESGGERAMVSRSPGFEVACRWFRSRPARWYWQQVRRPASAAVG